MIDKEKLIKIKSLADKMYYAAFNMTTDASLLRKAMDDYHQFIINEYHKEEPVSEDLMNATNNYCVNVRKGYPRVMDETDKYICNAFKAGAKWQKEQLMKDAIECKVDWYDGFLLDYTQEQQDELLEKIGADVGDKVKVIVIRED